MRVPRTRGTMLNLSTTGFPVVPAAILSLDNPYQVIAQNQVKLAAQGHRGGHIGEVIPEIGHYFFPRNFSGALSKAFLQPTAQK